MIRFAWVQARIQTLNNDSALRNWLGVLVGAGPGILGVFWGAPMVARELEAGTFRLAWTQSVTRTRWLAVKLGVVGLASMAAAGLLSLIVTWWASPLDRAHANVFNTFDERDIVPVAFALFAFVLGVIAGLVFRRTLPAMAATLVAFVGDRLAVTKWVRLVPDGRVPRRRGRAGGKRRRARRVGDRILVPSHPSARSGPRGAPAVRGQGGRLPVARARYLRRSRPRGGRAVHLVGAQAAGLTGPIESDPLMKMLSGSSRG